MIIPNTTTSKLYPDFIRKSKTLKRFSTKQRIFPKLGLDNCEERISKTKKIVFSGSGNQALWDIATMSMRGIASCQSWERRAFSKCLIGSMIDPCCGIIYITNGKSNRFGTNMLKRAIVRLCVYQNTGKPVLFIEKIYPYRDTSPNRYGEEIDNSETLNLFKEFLRRKTNKKLRILSFRDLTNQKNPVHLYIPSSQAVSRISEKSRSYRDSQLPYMKGLGYKKVSEINI